ncbi:hypothetical protein CVM52_05530 [Pseudooceanicola lipolyticus]|uniref:Polysaccharide chain length determinant N-terminal domain-containing protein n=1 Tax=Pseudooceanicola lipolyticus TaxID=2029104 RepID=A0A2M8J4K1_9RHOB|nr:Wzz/FepE/Etk N-terminal domain-containing protein [Pseudooceanicola lipolyticus]PJE37704.1 hypothetical protein CVM52_05530 [Pseudooceanicola lipolyticus]
MKDAGRDLLDTGWQEGPTGLAYIFRAIGRNFFTLLLTPLLFIAGGLAYLVTVQHLYTATAYLRVQLDDTVLTDNYSPLETHAQLIQSNRIISMVIEDLGLAETLKPTPGRLRQFISAARTRLELDSDTAAEGTDNESLLIGIVQAGLNVERVGRTEMIAVNYTSARRSQAMQIANAFATLYTEDVSGASDRVNQRRKDALEGRVEAIRDLAWLERDTARKLMFRNNYIVTSANDLEDRIAEFHQQLSTVSANEAEIRARLAMISQGDDMEALQASALQTDATLEIYSDLISASRKLEQLKNQPGVSQDTLDRLEESILGMRASLERAVRRIRDDLDLQLAVLTARKATVLEELGRIQDYGRSAEWAQLREAQRKAEIYERIHQQHLNDLEELNRSDASSDVKLISLARLPATPSYPKYKVLLVLTGIFGLLVGVAIAMSREWSARSQPKPALIVDPQLRRHS